MPVNVTPYVALKFSITFNGGTATAIECQVIDATLTLPGFSTGTITETACPDGKVSDPGTATNGTITGNVYVDTLDTGVTKLLADAYMAGAELPYEITYFSDQANTIALKFSGNCKVNSFTLPFGPKPGNAKQPLDLALITATIGRPVAA